MIYYDVKIYRKIRDGSRREGFRYQAGANLKPSDIPDLMELLWQVDDYLNEFIKARHPER
jgi:hypothetical protein